MQSGSSEASSGVSTNPYSQKEAPDSGAFFQASFTLSSLPLPPREGVPLKVGYFPSECVQVFGEKAGSAAPLATCRPASATSDVPPVAARRPGIVALLRAFLASRPPRRSLKAQGILRERVFGCDLAEHLANSDAQGYTPSPLSAS